MTKAPKRLHIVVDASVARAAGRGGGGPPAPDCVAALDAITRAGLGAAMSRELREEWNKHAGLYATQWLKNLVARGRFRFDPDPKWHMLNVMLSAASDLPGNQPTEVAKDSHLVTLAMATDRRVLSGDRAQASLLGRIVHLVPDLSQLHWVHPSDMTKLWLETGAPENANLCIHS